MKKYFTVDVGGTELKWAVMDEELNKYENGYVPTPLDSFEHFAETVKGVYEPFKEEVEGIALSLPGFIDITNGYQAGGGALAYNHRRYVGKELQEYCGCPVVLENDGKAAVTAEFYKGALQGCQNAAVFVIGTGVGGGLIINHEVIRGPHFTAGEFSFLNTNKDAFSSGFGAMLAGNCSTPSLLASYKALSGSEEDIDGREFFRRLPEDEAAQKTLEMFGYNVAVAAYNLYWLLDIEKLAIGGGISKAPALTEEIRKQFEKLKSEGPLAPLFSTMKLEIVTCQFSNDANLIGAMMAFINNVDKLTY